MPGQIAQQRHEAEGGDKPPGLLAHLFEILPAFEQPQAALALRSAKRLQPETRVRSEPEKSADRLRIGGEDGFGGGKAHGEIGAGLLRRTQKCRTISGVSKRVVAGGDEDRIGDGALFDGRDDRCGGAAGGRDGYGRYRPEWTWRARGLRSRSKWRLQFRNPASAPATRASIGTPPTRNRAFVGDAIGLGHGIVGAAAGGEDEGVPAQLAHGRAFS